MAIERLDDEQLDAVSGGLVVEYADHDRGGLSYAVVEDDGNKTDGFAYATVEDAREAARGYGVSDEVITGAELLFRTGSGQYV